MDGSVAGGARRSLRVDWLLTALSVWLVGGFYIDLWAHHHGRVDDSFFTPWHALLYTAAGSFGVVLGGLALRHASRTVAIRESLPPIYRVGFLGFLLFGIGGVLDLQWHAMFGFEVDTEALLSPTHLLLATSALLMIGTPLRSAGARLLDGGERSWRLAGPFIVPLAMCLAILAAFTQYAHPIVDVWSSRIDGPEVTAGAQLYAMASDGSGQRRLAILPGDARSPRFSPDGSRIVYGLAAPGEDGGVEIHVMSADGTDDRALTAEGRNIRPAWSPDGAQIAFSSSRNGGQFDLYVMAADGSNVELVTDTPADEWAAAWAPDASWIAYNSDADGNYHLYRVDADGSNRTQLTTGEGNDWEPAFSPDGSRIAFTSDRGGDVGVWLAAADGSNPAPLDLGDGDGVMPAWSPDGARIAFTSRRTGDAEVFVVATSGGDAVNLTQNAGVEDGWIVPAWSPDGRSIVYPSEGAIAAWREPFVRHGFGAAGILIFAGLLAGAAVFARRRGRLPFGAFTVLVAVPPILATVLEDQYQFIGGELVAGLLADVLARALPASSSRRADALFAFLVPALFFVGYFVTVAGTGGIGWSVHLWLGAIFTAGVIGLLLDEVGRRPGEVTAAVEERDAVVAEGLGAASLPVEG